MADGHVTAIAMILITDYKEREWSHGRFCRAAQFRFWEMTEMLGVTKSGGGELTLDRRGWWCGWLCK